MGGPVLEAGVAYGYRSFTGTPGYKCQNFYFGQVDGMEARYQGFMFSLLYTL